MTTDEIVARDAAVQAVDILENSDLAIDVRVDQALSLLRRAIRGRALHDDECSALDADPSIQAVLLRIASGSEAYYASGPDGLPIETEVDGDVGLSQDQIAALAL